MTDIESEPNTDSMELPEIPPYLRGVRNFLVKHEVELWKWFRADQQRESQRDSVKLDLRKSAVRLDSADNAFLYEAAHQAAEILKMDVPVTIYQATQSTLAGQLNASISIETREANIVLHGDLGERLDPQELLALFGHELCHLRLWTVEDGDYLTVANVLMGMAGDPDANAIYRQTLRRYNQFAEVYCDRGAMLAVGGYESVVSSLIKLETAVNNVNAASYLKQANEIFADDFRQDGSKTITHPELYIRTRALDLYARQARGFESSIARMILGRMSLDRMDLSQQETAQQLTRQLLDAVLEPDWMQCESTMAHARLFFDDYEVRKSQRKELVREVDHFDDDFKNYFNYVMLDLVTAERDIQEAALGHAIELAQEFDSEERFVESACKEMRLTKSRLKKIMQSAKDLADQATTLRDNRAGSSKTSSNNERQKSRRQKRTKGKR